MLMTLAQTDHGYTVLRLRGKLTARTYVPIRDSVIKAALDQPTAVIVDVNELEVPDDSAWTVFTSARWHVQQWPHIVIALACGDPAARREPVEGAVPAGLDIVDAVCRHWGSAQTPTGKTVWARVRPGDQITGIGRLLRL